MTQNAVARMEYTNRKGQTYYLHQGTTRTGKLRYYFSMKEEGNRLDGLPPGYEIYEHPNAQVFCRKIRPKIITDEEREVVEEAVKRLSDVRHFLLDVKKDSLVVYTANQDAGALKALLDFFPFVSETRADDVLQQGLTYSPVMRFDLVDREKRFFVVQRYCYLGSIDDWIPVSGPGRIELLAGYVRHLGKDSYYELF